jgi:uncharacterized protein YcbK (DUF882 family)
MRDCSVHVSSARLITRRLFVARTGYSVALALFICICGSKALQNAVAEGDTRTITMHHLHTGEDITITYKRNGRYDDAALEKLNWFLRDWRRGEQTRMDPHLIDLVWEVQREANAKDAIEVVCGYRAPQTNAMLRRRSGGVARFSEHMLGHALDFYIPGIRLEQLREIGLRLQRGGVGFYPTSGSPFVHMDTGGVRMWPRMTHDELARVFPDGRTVHIPSDGRPLPGYALALADVKKRGGMPSELSLDAARSAGVNVETVVASNERPAVNPFAKLLGLAYDAEDEDEDATPRSVVAAPPAALRPQAKATVAAGLPAAQNAAEKKPAPAKIADAGVNKPASETVKPRAVQAPVQVAALVPAVPSSAAGEPDDTGSAAATANQIIRTRGYWQGLPDGMAAAAAPTARPSARNSSKTAGNSGTTGVIGPFNDPRNEPRNDPRSDGAARPLTFAYAAQPASRAPVSPAATAATGSGAAVTAPRAVATSAEPQIRAERALEAEPEAPAEKIAPRGTTIAIKRVANQVASAILSASASSVVAIKAGARLENPWLRAVLVAPSVHRFLTTLALGTRDFRSLAALMVKPRSAVMMTFAAHPNPGLEDDRFSGAAVVFVSTVTYSARTAVLQQ